MLSEENRAELRILLRRLGGTDIAIESQIGGLEEAVSSFHDRTERHARSRRIGEVVMQLSALVDAARQGTRAGRASIPAEIFPETFSALLGRYPFSNVDLAPVTSGSLKGGYADLYRTAVMDASIESHVVNAALRQLPGEPHLVAVRSTPFPFDEAKEFFFGGLAETTAENFRKRLEAFVADEEGSGTPLAFLELVRDRVRLATRAGPTQNPGRRTLYSWAEPAPEPRLVWDVLETIFEPAAERPKVALRAVAVQIVDLLAGPDTCVRQDVISSMITIWVATCQHRIVAERLAGLLDGKPGRAEPPHQRRDFWFACHQAIVGSAAELLRRAWMGDHHYVTQLGTKPAVLPAESASDAQPRTSVSGGRATGLPMPTIDLASAATAMTDFQFLRRLASASKPWLRPR